MIITASATAVHDRRLVYTGSQQQAVSTESASDATVKTVDNTDRLTYAT